MSPTSTFAVSQLQQLVYYHLDNEALENANFIAGRLHAMEPRNPDTSHLLALTYHRLRRSKAAFDFAHKHGANGRHLGCAYVFALACHDLGRHTEGICALEKSRPLWIGRNYWAKNSEPSRRHIPDAAAVNNLLGHLWRGHGDARRAGDCYIEAHRASPFAWEAFQALCDIGADMDISKSFRLSPDMKNSIYGAPNVSVVDAARANEQFVQASTAQAGVLTPSNDPFGTTAKHDGDSLHPTSFLLPRIKSKALFGNGLKATNLTWETSTANGPAAEDDDIDMDGGQAAHAPAQEEAPTAPQRRTARSTLQRLGLDASKDAPRARTTQLRSHLRSESTDNDEGPGKRTQTNHKRTISGHASQSTITSEPDPTTSQPRRSNRLFSQITGSKTNATRSTTEAPSTLNNNKRDEAKKARATGAKGRGTSTVGRVVSGNRKIIPPNPNEKESRAPSRNSAAPAVLAPKQSADAMNMQEIAAYDALLTILRSLGGAYYALSRYEVPTAVETFKSLPVAQRETPWVLAQLGKAYYEAADYAAAESCFARMMKLQPTRLEDAEVYSNVLWQLKKPIQLAFLAHTLKDVDFDAPQTWCAVGNAFSLNREHEQAIACFKRATQVDSGFSYAWTLMGHELLTNEEFDEALSSFRKGIGSERRAYGAWYGLGKCYERMGKWEDAERHYRIAASINPSNSVLAVCIGVILEKLRHPKAALTQYTHALTLAPDSSLAHFKKARVLLNLRLYEDALVQLEALKNLAAEEANVWFLLGKCYKGLGNRAASVRAYTTALNLDPKAAQYIKEAMESLDDSEDDDVDDD
ncbi:hypothetical protein AAFC00_000131 [Neodothiora populina]|uniref:TPR-like protein n=1 Tax=Neodothiora populina TaxID=2781224 RepID=A0ABR3P1R1_9PEZI